MSRTVIDRFWEKVDRDGPVPERTYRLVPGQCWLWKGQKNGYGYGIFRPDGKPGKVVMVHRFAYEELVGEITEETLGHLCLTKVCVNPDHLEPTSRGENNRRRLEMQTLCRNGLHEIDGYDSGWCKECKRARRRREYDRMLAREGKERVGKGYNRLKTHCPKGHEYDEANTIRKKNGWRMCRKCHNASVRRSQKKKRRREREAKDG